LETDSDQMVTELDELEVRVNDKGKAERLESDLVKDDRSEVESDKMVL